MKDLPPVKPHIDVALRMLLERDEKIEKLWQELQRASADHVAALAREQATAKLASGLTDALMALRVGSCWCGLGIDHPSFSKHSIACIAAAEAIAKGSVF